MNKKLITPMFLLASFLLVGCSSDTIVARPTKWDVEKIFENVGDKDNKMKNIYDAIKNLGDTNANVLNHVMYEIAQNQLGSFDKLEEFNKLTKPTTEFKNWLAKHPKYNSVEKSTKLVDGKIIENTLTADQKAEVSLKMVKQQYEEIEENICEKLYDEIKGGSYSSSNSKLFQEIEYYRHLKKELYIDEQNILTDEEAAKLNADKVFLPKKKASEEPFKDYISKYLHINGVDNKQIYKKYIETKILPDLYKTYLTQSYVKEQRYSSLGRSYARKVNMITIAKTDSYKDNLGEMLNYFAKDRITGEKSEIGTKSVSYDFEDLTQAMIGFAGAPDIYKPDDESTASETYKLLNYTIENTKPEAEGGLTWNARTNMTPIKVKGTDGEEINLVWKARTNDEGNSTTDGTPTFVYYGTKLGDIVEKYMKVYDISFSGTASSDPNNKLNPSNFVPIKKQSYDETAYNDLTGSGSYSVETGLILKEREARQTDLTKDGWYLKNGGLTDLDTTYRDRLYNIKTSSLIDNKDKKSPDTAKDTYESGDYVRYFGDVTDPSSRVAFLTMETRTDKYPWESIVINTEKNYFMVAVEEAPSTTKLSNADNKYSYFYSKTENNLVDTAANINSMVNEIVKANSSSDTYKKNANEYYLMISNIVFYDQSVYDYFKSQFPDLFK